MPPGSRRAAAAIALCCALAGARLSAQQTGAPRDPSVAPAPAAGGAKAALPLLSPEAQAIVEQFTLSQAAAVEQLRFLQQTYRENGRAEDAAAVAAIVRQLQQHSAPATTNVTAELVLEGLANKDDPVRVSGFRGRGGQTLSFAVRGRDDQPIWGATTYTDDSPLETAAVHAGFLRVGQLGIVKVRVLPGQDQYPAANQNGVRSSEYGRSPGSYRVLSAAVVTPVRSSSLSSYRDLVGSSFFVPIVGATTGRVFGSDVYSDDSALPAAAVHAGVILPGEFGFVKVTLLPGQAQYEGTNRNGVTSAAYNAWDGSFRVEPAPRDSVLQFAGEDVSRLVPMDSLRGRTDVSFVIRVKGSATGPVWGSGIYTDDSSIAAAAVHAGLLKPDEEGLVRVVITAGRQSYTASEANGIKSQPYGPWQGSFRLAPAGK
jgi:hypothetical protein